MFTGNWLTWATVPSVCRLWQYKPWDDGKNGMMEKIIDPAGREHIKEPVMLNGMTAKIDKKINFRIPGCVCISLLFLHVHPW